MTAPRPTDARPRSPLREKRDPHARWSTAIPVLPNRATNFIALLLLLALPILAADATPPRAAEPAPELAPAVNWVLPIFTDKEGFRSMTLRGSEVRPSRQSVFVTDLSITIFSGDAEAKVDSILLSREANFFPKEQRATGAKAVRLIRDDFEVTGDGWTYDHSTKKISLQRNVRVTFNAAQLNDILK